VRRQHRSDLEKAVAEATIKAVIETSPGLRDSIRAALDKGAKPAEVIRRYGSRSPTYRQHPTTALSVDWIVDEWQREQGQIKPDESIDRMEG
jgi:hypothetical protein